MDETLFSESWYRVRNLKPALRRHVQIHRHAYRGQDWYVLQDHSSGRFHRFSPEAYQVIGLMDGGRTLDAIWAITCERLADDMPTQEEVISLLGQLHRADALRTDIPPDIIELSDRRLKERRQRFWGQMRSPLSIKIPLFDPDKLLTRAMPLVSPLFGWAGFVVWLAVVAWALVLLGPSWDALTRDVADRVFAMENLVLIWFVYPLVKVVHEFGHAFMVRKWGGEVHEMGVMILVLMPLPYVDASASLAFRDKRRRMLVGAAGILVELFLAALALIAWYHMEPGLPRAVAYNVLLICGVSTLLFNGNPLLRFDAYYILADFLEIPNLGARSNRQFTYLFLRYLVGVKEETSPAHTPGEAVWLSGYAMASFVYRIFISVRIILFIAGKFFVVGILLAIWAAFNMVFSPLYRAAKAWQGEPRLLRYKGRIATICLAAVATFLIVSILLPCPSFTVVEGVIWAPEATRVYAGSRGFIKRVVAEPGQEVDSGHLLVVCEDPELDSRVAILRAQLGEFQAKLRSSLVGDRTEAELLKEEITRIEDELLQAEERREDLKIESPAGGLFVLNDPAVDLPGRFVARGDLLGYVVTPSRVFARVVVPQEKIDEVRYRTSRVEARIAGSLNTVGSATVERIVPAASKTLPSIALSLEGGGKIALDPKSRDGSAFKPFFQLEISLPDATLSRLGERVLVRFVHEPEPLVKRWYRDVRRVFLRHFDV